jgi:hypothetical protein
LNNSLLDVGLLQNFRAKTSPVTNVSEPSR